MNILQAMADPKLFKPFFGELDSWKAWGVVLRALYGLPIKSAQGRELIQKVTGRDASTLPPEGFRSCLFLVGRRSGKSRIAATIGGFEALFGGHEKRLSKGELGILPLISPSRFQSTLLWRYLEALFDTPLLRPEIVDRKEVEKTLSLRSGLQLQVMCGDYRTVRGPAVVTGILDELAFFGYTEESKVRSDLELVRAIRPALMTTGGRLICISTKYAMRGFAYQTWKRYHGSNSGDTQYSPKWRVLVVDADSLTFNPTLPQAEIDAAYEEDPVAARSEFGGEWREDVQEFLPRSVIEILVVPGRRELLPNHQFDYRAGADLSGGRKESATLCIVHRDGKIVQDFIREWKTPYNPFLVVSDMAKELKRFGLVSVVGDAYAGEWPVAAFRKEGIRYRLADRSKNELYREMLPVLCGGKESIELLDSLVQTNQLASLERRTRSGGADVIDHPNREGCHDDVANALAVACDRLAAPTRRVGVMFTDSSSSRQEDSASLSPSSRSSPDHRRLVGVYGH